MPGLLQDTFNAANDLVDSGGRDSQILYEDREDAALQRIDEDNTTTAFVIFGAGHYWMNNVKRWNLENPHDKFSYIRLSYKKDEGKPLYP